MFFFLPLGVFLLGCLWLWYKVARAKQELFEQQIMSEPAIAERVTLLEELAEITASYDQPDGSVSPQTRNIGDASAKLAELDQAGFGKTVQREIEDLFLSLSPQAQAELEQHKKFFRSYDQAVLALKQQLSELKAVKPKSE